MSPRALTPALAALLLSTGVAAAPAVAQDDPPSLDDTVSTVVNQVTDTSSADTSDDSGLCPGDTVEDTGGDDGSADTRAKIRQDDPTADDSTDDAADDTTDDSGDVQNDCSSDDSDTSDDTTTTSALPSLKQLLKTGTFTPDATTMSWPGTVTETLTLPAPAKATAARHTAKHQAAQPTVLGSASKVVRKAGAVTLTIHLNAAGRRALRKSGTSRSLTLKIVKTRKGQPLKRVSARQVRLSR